MAPVSELLSSKQEARGELDVRVLLALRPDTPARAAHGSSRSALSWCARAGRCFECECARFYAYIDDMAL